MFRAICVLVLVCTPCFSYPMLVQIFNRDRTRTIPLWSPKKRIVTEILPGFIFDALVLAKDDWIFSHPLMKFPPNVQPTSLATVLEHCESTLPQTTNAVPVCTFDIAIWNSPPLLRALPARSLAISKGKFSLLAAHFNTQLSEFLFLSDTFVPGKEVSEQSRRMFPSMIGPLRTFLGGFYSPLLGRLLQFMTYHQASLPPWPKNLEPTWAATNLDQYFSSLPANDHPKH